MHAENEKLNCRQIHKPIIRDKHPACEHHHTPDVNRPEQQGALKFCIALTLVMMVLEILAGFLTSSLMLISDAIHMFSHVLALGISYAGIRMAQIQSRKKFSYGLYRTEILAAFLNGVGLLGFSAWIVYAAITRIIHPVAVMGPQMTVVAVIGLIVNLVTAFFLNRAGVEDLNTKSAFLHMLADTLSSLVIVIGGLIISFTNWFILDPLLSLVVAVFVVKWSWNLLHISTSILLEHKPAHIDTHHLVNNIKLKHPEIKSIHDVHIWEITSQYICMTMHIQLEDMKVSGTELIKEEVEKMALDEYGICHSTIQFEACQS